ncbi:MULTISPECIES: 3-ketoacyl-ACP reductase [Empedobacter]|uniref:3-ketoacyl-ACP reductase n=2 Tax=Empedobacter TaxID=59734 RepID=A0A3R8Z9R5_9FLAO|nr:MULTISPECIES: 3-ketoacyl-ACP reductase [Empedobacter]MBW1618309.1 3-ketoacyl-ACP reductase [Empedobacter falsenii]MDH0658751.1 3-ketoacyl-ACP reductase [Empedobacter sp. GD03865]MDH1602152.1 3-ketoacyl-ACP reductase [Empedobacter sp. GD03739]RRT93199.1 3-ketoacyl-ACP reductase [Empedobacter falsenii]RRT93341.1 3-ketoacyl-ACP reductase [Empedobacter falsenii]
MQDLKGKNALVTGGSRGLGKAVALALAKEGVNVAVTGRNTKTLEETVEEIKSFGVKADYSIFNVVEKVEVKMQLERLIESFGAFDILINNAGIAAFGSFLEMPENDWEEIVRTNLFGPYYVSKAVIPSMVELGSGDIINVSSTAGLKGNAVTSAYSASKAGLIGLSESLMFELRKKNIRVTTLTPSTIASEMSKDVLKITDGNPEKVLQPEDFAQLIVDLLKLDKRAMLASASLWSTNP